MADAAGKNGKATTDGGANAQPPVRRTLAPGIRSLILSYGNSDLDPAWDRDAFSRRVKSRPDVKTA